MTDNPWQFWQDALDGKKPQMSPDSPEFGYFRHKHGKEGVWLPVQIWSADGEWIATLGGDVLRGHKVEELWNWAGRFPITQEEFEQRTAGTWQGDDPTVAAAKTAGPPLNSEGVDEAEILRDQIAAAKQGAKDYEKITSDKHAAKAQALRARMNELSGEADKRREKLKRPHLEAGKAVDKVWMPLVAEAKAVADGIKRSMEAFATEQLRAQREAERKIEQERLAAEKEARQRAEAAGTPEQVEQPVEAPVAPLPATETTIKPTYGRAATKTVETYVAEITDQDAVYAFMKARDDVKAFLLDLAQRAHKAGHTVPGVRLDERVNVR